MKDYSALPTKEIERIALSVLPGAWSVESERPLATLLGSCVAVCMHDPQTGIGGLNHFMLPSMQRGLHGEDDTLLAGDFAMEALLNAMLARGARKNRLQAKAFGGGTIINAGGPLNNIGQRNADFAKQWLTRENIPLLASDFLGPWSRKVLFVPRSGDAFCKRMLTSMATAETIEKEEKAYAQRLQNGPSGSNTRIELF